MSKSFPKGIWVIVPAYNEAKYIGSVLSRIKKMGVSFLVVDDGSLDETAEIALKFSPHVLRHRINLGKGAALKTACEFAFQNLDAKAVVMIDADAQHNPAELPAFFEKLQQGHSIVLGVRSLGRKMPILKKLMNQFASLVMWLFFGKYIPDIPSGYKGFTREAYQKIQWEASTYDVEMEIAARMAKHNLPFVTVCIETIYHDMNKGMTVLDVIHMIKQTVNWRFSL